MLEVINFFDGVVGVYVMICSLLMFFLRMLIKWEGVSFISNIQYDEECLRVWKVYKIGFGKFVLYSKFNCLFELLFLFSLSDNFVKVNFVFIKLR